MPGGLIQLIRRGPEDLFFNATVLWSGANAVFRRTSNFAIEPLSLSWKTMPAFGSTAVLTLDRLGDLVCGVALAVTVSRASNATSLTAAYYPVEALFKQISLVIDGVVIDTHTSDWLRIYNTTHQTWDQQQKYMPLVNFDPATISAGGVCVQTCVLPLQFSFCRSLSCALPLVAMAYSEVQIQVTLADAHDIGLDPSVLHIQPLANYVFVDLEERQRLAHSPLDVVIEQVQVKTATLPDGVPSTTGTSSYAYKFNLFKPVKALYWFLRPEFDVTHGRYIGDPTTTPFALAADPSCPSGLGLTGAVSGGEAPLYECKLSFDDSERTPSLPFGYFNRVVPYRSFKGQPVPGVAYFSFGLDPESTNDPKGTCNFSIIREVRLDLSIKRSASLSEPNALLAARDIVGLKQLVVLAWGLNVVHVEGGRATLAF